LDALQRTPSTVLLSAQEAKDRLREIVEGFFFWRLRTEDGKRIGRLLVKIRAAESGRNPEKFQTPVWDTIWQTETLLRVGEAVQGAGATRGRCAGSAGIVLGLAAEDIQVRDRPK
jgi:hypothetical protein